ncbi:hypothetical protein [Calothrix sp. PCC 7507]|uniref:hypothetical protein n=1 Tax=Calothrix sp. PCC 7507 TaxID=99598 RepID=UPI00029F4870|nr:hypothetical protein [Calothrix sp. PCC 7507]AFY33150.1 hypothetical protein Cal7507_2730 [Calothrix sp. PCC 7507]
MILTEAEIQQVLAQAQAAFPNLTNWEYINEKNSEYFGFSVWGEFVLNPEVLMSRSFFITLDTYEDKWQACLTVGQHSYLWSSADAGDAHLLDTEPCESLEEAITLLKAKMVQLLAAFSAV